MSDVPTIEVALHSHDAELNAIEIILAATDGLTLSQRLRVLRFVLDRFTEEDQ